MMKNKNISLYGKISMHKLFFFPYIERMSQVIPVNNIPVYLQKYTIHILDESSLDKKGDVQYGTVGALPSNKREARVWDINLTGQLEPNVEKYKIVYDFSNVNYRYKEQISFENDISGTFRICGHMLDASKIMSYEYSDENSTLSLIIDTKKWGFRLKRKVLFSFSINVDDDASQCCNTCTGDLPADSIVCPGSAGYTVPSSIITPIYFVSPTGGYFAIDITDSTATITEGIDAACAEVTLSPDSVIATKAGASTAFKAMKGKNGLGYNLTYSEDGVITIECTEAYGRATCPTSSSSCGG